METNEKRLIIGIAIFVSVIILILVFVLLKNMDNIRDLSELNPIIERYFVEYKSERGFGNDRFDIYSFELKKNSEINLFKSIDAEFKDEYNYFETMVENVVVKEDSGNMDIRIKIKKYISNESTKYLSVDLGGIKKLYIYNEEMNKGYCLILTI